MPLIGLLTTYLEQAHGDYVVGYKIYFLLSGFLFVFDECWLLELHFPILRETFLLATLDMTIKNKKSTWPKGTSSIL